MKNSLPFLLGALLASGCVSSVNTVQPAQPAAVAPAVADRRVISNPDLDKAVRVLAVHTLVGAEGFMSVDLQIQNPGFSPSSFSYRFDWFNINGMSIELPTTAPIPMSLLGREITTLTMVAPSPLARDFTVTFLPAN